MNEKQPIKIFNGKIITPEKIIDGGTILIQSNRIEAISNGDIEVAIRERLAGTTGCVQRGKRAPLTRGARIAILPGRAGMEMLYPRPAVLTT